MPFFLINIVRIFINPYSEFLKPMDKTQLIRLLNSSEKEEQHLIRKAFDLRNATVGNGIHLRGLIEISNICRKDCLYCGIRRSNARAKRFFLDDRDIIESALFAWEHHYGSIVLQGGEQNDPAFISRIEKLLKEIKKLTHNQLGITLSLGEQEADTYRRWFDSGAHRYLLRIETSDPTLYRRIHPDNDLHSHRKRLDCLEALRQCGYQTGSGIMIGLPFQTIEQLADDLLFLRQQDLDMVGMGPYLEHPDTPLYEYRHLLMSQKERLRLGIKMVACLRLLMPDINIAATTALQAIDPEGREKAMAAGANVIMPNITPPASRSLYKLYENKPDSEEGAATLMQQLVRSTAACGCKIIFDEWGDSPHFQKRRTPH